MAQNSNFCRNNVNSISRWRMGKLLAAASYLLGKVGFTTHAVSQFTCAATFALAILMLVTFDPQAHATCPAGSIGQSQVNDGSNCYGSAAYLDSFKFPDTGTVYCATNPPKCTGPAGKIEAAICALPAAGGTIDARGFCTTTSCSTTFSCDPFEDPNTGAPSAKAVRLLLPSGTITTTATLGMADKHILEGVGVGDGTLGTTLIADSTTPPSVMICMGAILHGGSIQCIQDTFGGPAQFNIQIRNLKIDCNGDVNANGIGIETVNAEEGSTVDHYVIQRCPVYGIYLNGSAAQNSGPYAPGQIYVGGSNTPSPADPGGCTSNSIGFQVSNVDDANVGPGHITIGPGGGCASTCSTGGNCPVTGFDFNGHGGHIGDLHFQGFTNGLLLGDNNDTTGLAVDSVTGGPVNNTEAYLVKISSNNTVTGRIGGLWLNAANHLILDNQNGGLVVDNTSLSDYWIGPPQAAGNIILNKSIEVVIANNPSNAPVVNKWAKLATASGNSTVTLATLSSDYVVGICKSNCSTSGNAQIAYDGQSTCIFDNATTAGDFVQISSVGGCHDAGSTYPTSGGDVKGRVLSSGAAGTYNILMFPPEIHF
jgi:hypothetical protein